MSNYYRKDRYLITINNPLEHGLNSQLIKDTLLNLNPVYACYSDEIGLEEHTPHCHVYLCFDNARSFNTIKGIFPSAHIDESKGTHEQNRDYVFKIGKWANDEKADTNIIDSHWEIGNCPSSKQGKRNDLIAINDCIENGMSASDIIKEYPQYSFSYDKINSLINVHKGVEYKDIFRNLHNIYLSGTTGSGKTRTIMETYGYSNVYRVTDYKNPFDSYNYQPVILFDEFRSDISCKDMLKYLDGYPIELPCRYSNKQACYTITFIVSNIPLEQQFIDIKYNEKETFHAFLRRIDNVIFFSENKKVFYENMDFYNKGIEQDFNPELLPKLNANDN